MRPKPLKIDTRNIQYAACWEASEATKKQINDLVRLKTQDEVLILSGAIYDNIGLRIQEYLKEYVALPFLFC